MSLHDIIIVWLSLIISVVVFIFCFVYLASKNKGFTYIRTHSTILEVLWTIIPIFILFRIGVPSILLLTRQDFSLVKPSFTLKLLRNQWNWQRESERELIDHTIDVEKLDELRGFSSPLILKRKRVFRILLTRRDVLHSLGLPSLGIKLDSTPGRLNAVISNGIRLGLVTGSCYELCGRGHSAMPIYILLV